MGKKVVPVVPVVNNKCTVCGKTLTRAQSLAGNCGSKCASLVANKVNVVALRASHTVPTVPQGYITVANLHRWLVANPQHGCSVSRMVKAIGGDRVVAQPLNPICKPVYVNGQRWVNAWLGTPAGAMAMATGNFGQAPKA